MHLQRRGTRSYPYVNIRQDGKVVSVYCGKDGERAEAILAAHRAEVKARREAETRRMASFRAELAALDGPLDDLDQLADRAFRAGMASCGFRQFGRDWRLDHTMLVSNDHHIMDYIPIGHDPVFALMDALAARFAAGDQDKHINAHLMMKQWKEEVSEPFMTDLEKILVDRVVVCKMNVYISDIDVEIALETVKSSYLVALVKRRASAHAMLLSAVRALNKLRDAQRQSSAAVLSLGSEGGSKPVNRLAELTARN